jgi:hypothetical protein
MPARTCRTAEMWLASAGVVRSFVGRVNGVVKLLGVERDEGVAGCATALSGNRQNR